MFFLKYVLAQFTTFFTVDTGYLNSISSEIIKSMRISHRILYIKQLQDIFQLTQKIIIKHCKIALKGNARGIGNEDGDFIFYS